MLTLCVILSVAYYITCKLFVTVSSAAKLRYQFPTGLEDEHHAGLVVHNDNVTVLIHRDALRTHQPTRPKLSLQKRKLHQEMSPMCLFPFLPRLDELQHSRSDLPPRSNIAPVLNLY